jgi:hypothetical protein
MLKKNSRIFTFGCSFTEFPWPTWADIIIRHAETTVPEIYCENWGRAGAGNQYIASTIWECHAKHKLTSDDYVFVCWTSIFREDRHVDGRWQTMGELIKMDDNFTEKYIDKYTKDIDSNYNIIKDSGLIQSTQLALKQLNVTNIHFTMHGLTLTESDPNDKVFPHYIPDQIASQYDIKFDGEPMMKVLNLRHWDSPEFRKARMKSYWPGLKPDSEWHPTPKEHLTYLEKQILHKVDFLKDGINEHGLKLVSNYMDYINSFNGEPVSLDRKDSNWQVEMKTPRW